MTREHVIAGPLSGEGQSVPFEEEGHTLVGLRIIERDGHVLVELEFEADG